MLPRKKERKKNTPKRKSTVKKKYKRFLGKMKFSILDFMGFVNQSLNLEKLLIDF